MATQPWLDRALEAADRALREAIALNRGILAESTGLRQRVEALWSGKADLAEISDVDLLAELGRRLKASA